MQIDKLFQHNTKGTSAISLFTSAISNLFRCRIRSRENQAEGAAWCYSGNH